MTRPRLAYPVAMTIGLSLGACNDPTTPECYDLDPNSPIALADIDPVYIAYEGYCGRGPTEVEGLSRHLISHCVARPAEGCKPCSLDADEADALILDAILARFESLGCPTDYEPERIVRGCMAEWTDSQECCWSVEYFTDAAICDPDPPNMRP